MQCKRPSADGRMDAVQTHTVTCDSVLNTQDLFRTVQRLFSSTTRMDSEELNTEWHKPITKRQSHLPETSTVVIHTNGKWNVCDRSGYGLRIVGRGATSSRRWWRLKSWVPVRDIQCSDCLIYHPGNYLLISLKYILNRPQLTPVWKLRTASNGLCKPYKLPLRIC